MIDIYREIMRDDNRASLWFADFWRVGDAETATDIVGMLMGGYV